MGPPFTSRRTAGAGLSFPKVKAWPAFICEACTVRSTLNRELGKPGDLKLLALERMRILDLAHAWTEGTYRSYAGKWAYLRRFEASHPGLRFLVVPKAERPPSPPSIPLMWAELAYSVTGRTKTGDGNVSFNTVRQIRSAAAQFWGLGWMITRSGEVLLDPKHDSLSLAHPRPSDEATMTYFSKGLAARLGTASKPALPLLERHIIAIDAHFEALWDSSGDYRRQQDIARAALANSLAWLAWLRASELFGLRWCDITLIHPSQGQDFDLPRGVGALLLRLAPETKSMRNKAVDVPVAYRTKAGLRPGLWFERLSECLHGLDPVTSVAPIFCHASGGAWTSGYYRHTYIYPVLSTLALAGDAHLRPYTDFASLAAAFYSMHAWRRGARSHVARLRGNGHKRLATHDEIYEHARWTRRRSSEAIDLLYKELPLYDRIVITLLCM